MATAPSPAKSAAVAQVAPAAERYRSVGAQGATNTQRAYAADLRSYESFCQEHQFSPYPADVLPLTSYLAHLADKRRQFATIKRHLASIQKRHHQLKLTSAAGTPEVDEVVQGIKRVLKEKQRQAPAFTVEYLKQQIAQLDLATAQGLRDRALLLVGFAGAFRRSELAALAITDFGFRGEALIISLGTTKTNQGGAVQEKALFRTDNPLYCPVTAFDDWVKRLGGRQTGPVFVSIRRGPKGSGGVPTRKPLSTNSINTLVQRHLGEFEPGVPYTAHSFRASFITTAKLAGQSNDFIRNQTNHKTDAILQRYTRLSNVVAYNASKALGL